MLKPASVTVTLMGASGTRSTEIQPRGGFFTRHVKAPRESTPSIFEPVPPKTNKPTPVTQGEAILDVLRNTEPGWHFDDEILYIATAKCRLKMDHRTLALVLESLVADGRVQVKTEERNMYRLTPDPIAQGNALKSLLMEVDAILEGGIENG